MTARSLARSLCCSSTCASFLVARRPVAADGARVPAGAQLGASSSGSWPSPGSASASMTFSAGALSMT
jgi:hypothetical protein